MVEKLLHKIGDGPNSIYIDLGEHPNTIYIGGTRVQTNLLGDLIEALQDVQKTYGPQQGATHEGQQILDI